MIKRFVLLALAASLGFVAHAQRSLADLASSAGVDWLVGGWTADTDQGAIQLTFATELDNHLATVHYRDSRSETKGMIYLPPGTQEPKYLSVNNRGATGTGVWSAEDGKAILKLKQVNADEQTVNMGLVFRKIDGKTMTVAFHALDSSDQLEEPARWTVELKRK